MRNVQIFVSCLLALQIIADLPGRESVKCVSNISLIGMFQIYGCQRDSLHFLQNMTDLMFTHNLGERCVFLEW